MKTAATIALVLGACSAGSDDAFPIAPGGGAPPVITPAPDGAPLDASRDDGSVIAARVCVVTDPRTPGACAVGNAGGIMVTLGPSTATTAMDGSFTIAAPSTSNLVWGVTAAGFVPTVMPLGTVHVLPVLTALRYSELVLDNGAVVQAGQGSLFVRVVSGGASAVGVTATVEPASVFGPLYDGGSAVIWDRDATGGGGMVWIPDVLAGTATLTLTGPSTPPVTLALPVVEGAITFGTVAVP